VTVVWSSPDQKLADTKIEDIKYAAVNSIPT
jgi:hypothetical protein